MVSPLDYTSELYYQEIYEEHYARCWLLVWCLLGEAGYSQSLGDSQVFMIHQQMTSVQLLFAKCTGVGPLLRYLRVVFQDSGSQNMIRTRNKQRTCHQGRLSALPLFWPSESEVRATAFCEFLNVTGDSEVCFSLVRSDLEEQNHACNRLSNDWHMNTCGSSRTMCPKRCENIFYVVEA